MSDFSAENSNSNNSSRNNIIHYYENKHQHDNDNIDHIGFTNTNYENKYQVKSIDCDDDGGPSSGSSMMHTDTRFDQFIANSLFCCDAWFSKPVKFLIGTGTLGTPCLECRGVIPTLMLRSKFVKEMFPVDKNLLIEDECAGQTLQSERSFHLLERFQISGNPAAEKAFKFVWNYLHNQHQLPFYCDPRMDFHTLFISEMKWRLSKNHLKFVPVHLTPPQWDFEFEVLKHMKTFFDYFAACAGMKTWIAYLISLLSICPYKENLEQVESSLSTPVILPNSADSMVHIQNYLLHLDVNPSYRQNFFIWAKSILKIYRCECILDNCDRKIDSELLNKWLEINNCTFNVRDFESERSRKILFQIQRCHHHRFIGFALVSGWFMSRSALTFAKDKGGCIRTVYLYKKTQTDNKQTPNTNQTDKKSTSNNYHFEALVKCIVEQSGSHNFDNPKCLNAHSIKKVKIHDEIKDTISVRLALVDAKELSDLKNCEAFTTSMMKTMTLTQMLSEDDCNLIIVWLRRLLERITVLNPDHVVSYSKFKRPLEVSPMLTDSAMKILEDEENLVEIRRVRGVRIGRNVDVDGVEEVEDVEDDEDPDDLDFQDVDG